MSYSLNEIDALCRKAARGAGFDWGHAEEAGKAARWLQAHGLPGAEQVLRCLQQRAAPPDPQSVEDDTWQGDGPLCPLLTGACLSDHIHNLCDRSLILSDIRQPILLAPFAAIASQAVHRAIRLSWSDVSILVLGLDAQFKGDPEALLSPRSDAVICQHSADRPPPHDATWHRADLAPDTYAGLDAFAQRTYAPATEASRAAGAGAGLTDND